MSGKKPSDSSPPSPLEDEIDDYQEKVRRPLGDTDPFGVRKYFTYFTDAIHDSVYTWLPKGDAEKAFEYNTQVRRNYVERQGYLRCGEQRKIMEDCYKEYENKPLDKLMKCNQKVRDLITCVRAVQDEFDEFQANDRQRMLDELKKKDEKQ
jgi:hypothetical protein